MKRLAPAAAAPKLRLDDILDSLQGPKGTQVVRSLKATLEKQGAKFGEVMGPGLGPDHFETPLDATVANLLYGSFLTGAQTVAALPEAVTYAFAQVADDSGLVDKAAVQKVFGAEGARLFDELVRQIGDAPVPTARRNEKYDHLPEDVILTVAKSAKNVDLATRMPALGAVTKALGGPAALAGVKMVAVQHLFPTTETLFHEFQKNGVKPADTLVLGKNYSANPDVLYSLKADGWNVPTLPLVKLLSSNPDGTSREVSPIAGYLGGLFDGVDPATAKKPSFLLLDEGGRLVKALCEQFPQFAPLCVAVEQTDHGIQVLEQMQRDGQPLLCPVVSVARSKTKKQLEAPMIGEAVVHATFEALENAHAPDTNPKKEACIVGYGAVGKATADALRRRGYTVYVNDIVDAKMDQAKADGCIPLPRDEALAHGQLLISCTGRTTITPDEFDALLPDHAVLVNAGSGNHELGMDRVDQGSGFITDDSKEHIDELGFRLSEFGGREVVLGDIAGQEEGFTRVLRTQSGHERLVIRSGYVVNMIRDIPPEFIELTRGMLLGACLQAVGEKAPGVLDLSPVVQDTVVAATRAELGRHQQTLEAPDFRTLKPAES